MKERSIVIDWSDLKSRFLRSVAKGEPWNSQPVMNERLSKLFRHPYAKGCGKPPSRRGWFCCETHWEGGNGSDTLGWLREGYRAEAFKHSAEMVPLRQKRHAHWSDEEGDPDSGRLLGGYDEFFLDTEKRESKPGLRVQIEFAFAAGCDAKTIEQYGAWCAGLLGALEASGFDLVVDLWIPLDNLYVGDYGVRSNVLVRVKRPNEVSDFTEWSALFSPTGYRHLGFTAKCVAGDKIGKEAGHSLGTTISGKTWGVLYEPAEGLVKITANQQAYKGEQLPIDALNAEAKKHGLI